ncbi:MAG: bifunctional NAD(P)H-hydrate repair enzyme [Betaproteobacteria bacterium]|nr:MAG: bifunctional NAD(P)H-hydrate repair enzyme [Betaproteobacteria bacterium]
MRAFDTLPPVCRVAEVRAIEAAASGQALMERAGAAAAQAAQAMLAERAGPVVVLAGPGNNGGDGLVVARRLHEAFHDVVVVFRGDAGKLPPDAARAYAAWREAGGDCTSALPPRRPALVVDALYGIGLGRPLAPRDAEMVQWANAQDAPVLALDVPTGLNAETGIATAPAVRATRTTTFIALKPGLLTGAGPDLCGRVDVDALGLDVRDASGRALAWPPLARALPEVLLRRTRSVHKGTFGTLLVVGGAAGMLGAPLLAGRAALRCGAGRVRIGWIADDAPAVDPGVPELMLREAGAVLADGGDALVLGCGLGTSPAARDALGRAVDADVPLVLDADALNLLAGDPALRARVRSRGAATVATPHPAEAGRLLGKDVAGVQHDRLAAAQSIAAALRSHVVLKGAGSVIVHPDGAWAINRSGNPALACAGTGDVLAGLVGALLAQGLDAATALEFGVCLHGAAADELVARGAGPVGVLASEVADAARDLVNRAARAHEARGSASGQ